MTKYTEEERQIMDLEQQLRNTSNLLTHYEHQLQLSLIVAGIPVDIERDFWQDFELLRNHIVQPIYYILDDKEQIVKFKQEPYKSRSLADALLFVQEAVMNGEIYAGYIYGYGNPNPLMMFSLDDGLIAEFAAQKEQVRNAEAD